MLQSVLHVLAQQMRVLGKNVELRGSVAQLPVARENVQTVAITEYLMETDENQVIFLLCIFDHYFGFVHTTSVIQLLLKH